MQLAVVVIGLLAALLFYVGSIGVPHERQSIDGVTPYENQIKSRQKFANWTAIGLSIVAVAIQIAVIVTNPT
jgi:hypothetical protein